MRSFFVLALLCAAVVSCASAEKRPITPPSKKVKALRLSAGEGAQDCGEAMESKTDVTCRAQPVGECMIQALKACRPAYGTRSFFTSEGDPIRVDWLVLSDDKGGCELVNVEDRSADPLASKRPSVQTCESLEWTAHESIKNCEVPEGSNCHSRKELQ
jgi:hypothetical protein